MGYRYDTFNFLFLGGSDGTSTPRPHRHQHNRKSPAADVNSELVATSGAGETLTDWAQIHPLCQRNLTAYVGQTARMHCCLARLDRELNVSEPKVIKI